MLSQLWRDKITLRLKEILKVKRTKKSLRLSKIHSVQLLIELIKA